MTNDDISVPASTVDTASNNLELTILRSVVQREGFCRKVLPHIKPEYFLGATKLVYSLILDFISKYNKLPDSTCLQIELQQTVNDTHRVEANELIQVIANTRNPTNTEEAWLLDVTEKWCKERALYLAIMESINIIDGKKKGLLSPGAIPEILSKALSVSFDTNVGHDYIDSSDKRYDFYHTTEDKIPFDLQMFNTITNNGVPRKTLNIIMASTGVGKSLVMCHMAAAMLSQGRNVLYITMEMAEERIAERIDANLFDVSLDQLATLSQDSFRSKIKRISERTRGKLIIKEYPTASAHTGHFRALLQELKLKRNIIPEVIFIDYLNICASSRMKGLGGSINSYSFIKAIAEEIRGLAVEFNVPIWSATQVNRTGSSSSDIELTDTSESFGLPATADFMVALIATEQLDNLNQMMVKQLKNRYSDMSRHRRFIIGVDRAKMRLYDVEDSAQTLLSSEGNSGGSNNKGPATDQQKPQFGHNAGIKRFRPGVVGAANQ